MHLMHCSRSVRGPGTALARSEYFGFFFLWRGTAVFSYLEKIVLIIVLPHSLAYAEMRIIMARLIYNFDMELVDPEDNWMDQKVFFLWTKPPLNVYLTPVQR